MPAEISTMAIRFGYWPIVKKVELSWGIIEPVEGLSKLIADISKTTCSKNGAMHPPVHKMHESRDSQTWSEVPYSEHGAELYHWYATHTLKFKNPIVHPMKIFKENPNFFICQYIGFIEGVLCMPEDWFFWKIAAKKFEPSSN